MKTLNSLNTLKKYSLALILGGVLATAVSLPAADAKSYQVTGPVLAIGPTSITVQKGEEKWEIARNSSTKVQGDLKVGAKVTIYYTMIANEVEVKGKSEKKK